MQKKLLFFLLLLVTLQACAQDNIEVINIENSAVHAYMADTTYNNDKDYRNTVVYNYYGDAWTGTRLDWPAGKLAKWKRVAPLGQIAEVRVTVSEHENYSDSVTHNPDSISATSFVIRNTIPGRTYYYKVEEILKSGDVNHLTDGAFRTEGQVRMIQVRGARNVRDMGGWPTQYGSPVKYGKLYRSGSLDAMKALGRHDFADNLGVGAELDLRSESRLKSSRLGEDKDYLLQAHDAGLKGLQNNKLLYRKDLKWIIDRLKEGKSVNWHCAIGCDRCGTVSFLIGGLLGLSEISLSRDFELSSFAKHKRPRAHINSMLRHVKTYGPEDDLAKCFYNYWLSVGMTKDELDFFIAYMLDML